MKKTFAVLLTFVMTATFAFASAESDSFVFRDQITWGMSEEKVAALEGEGMHSDSTEGYTARYYNSVPVGEYDGHMAFVFSSDQLVLCMYVVEEADQEMFDAMKAVLDGEYGEEQEVSGRELYDVVVRVSPGYNMLDELLEAPLCKWSAAGDTKILLTLENNNLEMIYISPEYLTDPEPEAETGATGV